MKKVCVFYRIDLNSIAIISCPNSTAFVYHDDSLTAIRRNSRSSTCGRFLVLLNPWLAWSWLLTLRTTWATVTVVSTVSASCVSNVLQIRLKKVHFYRHYCRKVRNNTLTNRSRIPAMMKKKYISFILIVLLEVFELN